MKEKVIIQFIHELGDGGASALVKDYSLLLSKKGYRVVVIVVFPAADTVNYSILINSGIEIRPVFDERSFINRAKNKFLDKRYISRYVLKTIQELRPIAVHIHLAVLRYLVPISRELQKYNLLFTCHSVPKRNFEGINAIEHQSAVKLIQDNNLQIIALHEDMACELNERFGIVNTVVIKNGININRFREVSVSKAEIRRTLNIPVDAYVVGHVGRFSAVKNHVFLLQVFKEVKLRNEKAFLLLIGTGELLDSIKQQSKALGIDDSVLILTHRTDIPELMKAMDVFTLPSQCEGFSIATLEAEVSGLYCVVANTLPQQVFLSDRLTALPLDAPIGKWVDALLKPKEGNDVYGDIMEYDINREVDKLEKLYLRKL